MWEAKRIQEGHFNRGPSIWRKKMSDGENQLPSSPSWEDGSNV